MNNQPIQNRLPRVTRRTGVSNILELLESFAAELDQRNEKGFSMFSCVQTNGTPSVSISYDPIKDEKPLTCLVLAIKRGIEERKNSGEQRA